MKAFAKMIQVKETLKKYVEIYAYNLGIGGTRITYAIHDEPQGATIATDIDALLTMQKVAEAIKKDQPTWTVEIVDAKIEEGGR